MTEKRFNKIKNVVLKRQKYLTIVLENIHDPHNAAAIFRTADAVGIDKIYLVYNTNEFPKIGRITSGSAVKWIERMKFNNAKECIGELKGDGYSVYSTHMDVNGANMSLYDLDLTGRTALIFGNEKEGVSEEARELSDGNFLIPMNGMVQSLNVSVAAAVCLYEAMRQRQCKGMYDTSEYSPEELKIKEEIYLNK
ncbi:MAG: RNA methyltransferase [Ignavibacteriae bacterium]|nr:RNA methyltransferase [Ignavibacteriota bacterium]